MGSFDWRIEVNTQDLSTVPTGTAQGEIGGMVILSSKAAIDPVYFGVGQGSRIVDYFGKPSTTYPDVQEAIDYNAQYPLWVCSPVSTEDTRSTILITSTGSDASDFALSPIAASTALSAYTFLGSNDFILLSSKSIGADDLGVKTSYDDSENIFTMEVHRKSTSGTLTLLTTYNFSLDATKKDGFGNNIFIDNVLGSNDYFDYVVNPLGDPETLDMTADAAVVEFDGGNHIVPTDTSLRDAQLVAGWAKFRDEKKYPAQVFMSSYDGATVVAEIDSLSKTYRKYDSFIIMFSEGLTVANAIAAKAGFAIDNSNIAFYWNRAVVNQNSIHYVGPLTRSMVGRIGIKFAAMQNVFDGLAPSYIDEGGHGGQLGMDISRMVYEVIGSNESDLDAAGINPLILDNVYGCMVAGQRTAKNPLQKSDYSWIGHARLFNYIIRNVINNVLVYQVTKLNDSTHRFQAQVRTEDIIKPILSQGILADAKILCNDKNNPPSVLQDRKFVLSLAVKVTPFSEFIQFNFINVGQLTDVQTVL